MGRSIPVLAITMGDPAGIGPEVCVKALARMKELPAFKPLVIGDIDLLKNTLKFLDPKEKMIDFSFSGSELDPSVPQEEGTIPVIQPPDVTLRDVSPGKLSAAAGLAAVRYIQTAIELAKRDLIDGIVTAPINKEAIHLAGFNYPGHTEIFAEGFNVKHYSLVLSAEGKFIFHVTTHIALRQALNLINEESVYHQIRLAYLLSKAIGAEDSPIAVAGVNPHAGEDGLFGDEEIVYIKPAVLLAQSEGIPVVGPLPADVVFPRWAKGQYRFCVAMYHDQGHSVFKSIYFDSGVNITVGLPVIRTSVDHGTAFDIAGKGIANEQSMMEAIRLAALLGPKWPFIYAEANK